MSLPHAVKWSFLSEVASKGVTPLIFVVLARLLTPADYGVVAAATMVISFSQVFWEAGMAKAIVQYQGDRDAAADAAFWINCVLGLVVAIVLVVAAPAIAQHVFHDARVSFALQLMSSQVFLSALSSVHTALLLKDMQFRRLFWVRLATVAAPGVVSIPLAWLGFGYGALVAGAILGQAVQALVLWQMCRWRPRFSLDIATTRQLGRFGAWVAVSGLSGWFYLWADSLVVGMYLGAHDLGLYRSGNAFVVMVYGFAFGPLLPVVYSHMSGLQRDRERVRQVLAKVARILTFVGVPAGFLMYALAVPLSEVAFGSGWRGIELVIAVMALTHGFAWTVGANGEAYRAIGRPDYETKVMAGTLPLYLLGYVLSVRYGLVAFLWTRFAMALAGTAVQIWAAHAALALPVGRGLLYLCKISVVGVPLLFLAQYVEVGTGVWQQLTLAAAAIGLTAAYLWLIEHRSLIPETVGMLKQSVRG